MDQSSRLIGEMSNGGQQDMPQAHLLYAAALFFTNKLHVPVTFDWGIRSDGGCQCEQHFDCKHPGKHPAIKAPRTHATDNMAVIIDMILRGRNLAAVPMNYVVVDVELGPTKDGLTPFIRWLELAGLDPIEEMSTLTVVSGGGGRHFWYWLPPDRAAAPPKGMDRWLPDVDIKTSAKISDKATLPGSRHASGQVYEFDLNALGGSGFRLPRRAPDVLLDEVAAGRAWRYQPNAEPVGSASSGGVRFADAINAAMLWRNADILPPGSHRPVGAVPAGLRLGSLSDDQRSWVERVTS